MTRFSDEQKTILFPARFFRFLTSLFTKHPSEAGETYFQHLIFTLGLGLRFLALGFVVVIHGIFPFVFVTTSSREIERISRIMSERKAYVEQLRAERQDDRA